jgi:hypothetical protein
MTESVSRWHPVSDVESPCGDIVLHAEPGAVTARLTFSTVRDRPPRDVLVRFGRVLACASHEEFAHPWNTLNPAEPWPRLEGEWATYAYPLLEVHNSQWLASFSDSQVLDPERAAARHYRFVSLDNIVDVLTLEEAQAAWVPPAP